MSKISLPLKIAFAIFAISIVIAGIAFDLEKKIVFFISLIIVIISAAIMVALHEKQK